MTTMQPEAGTAFDSAAWERLCAARRGAALARETVLELEKAFDAISECGSAAIRDDLEALVRKALEEQLEADAEADTALRRWLRSC